MVQGDVGSTYTYIMVFFMFPLINCLKLKMKPSYELVFQQQLEC